MSALPPAKVREIAGRCSATRASSCDTREASGRSRMTRQSSYRASPPQAASRAKRVARCE